MNKLGERNYLLISMSMKNCGFNQVYDAMMYEEEWYADEAKEIVEFLEWLLAINRPFGKSNYEQRFSEFKSGEKPPTKWFEVHTNFPATDNKAGFQMPGFISKKRISADATNKLQIAARLGNNFDDPDYIKVVEIGGTYEKEYDVKEMGQFVNRNKKIIQSIQFKDRKKYPTEFF